MQQYSGMKTRPEIKELAKERFKEQRGTSILLVIMLCVVIVASTLLGQIVLRATGDRGVMYWIVFVVGYILILVIGVNMYGEQIKIWNQQEARVGALFSELSVNFFRKLGGMLWMILWITLWSFLLAIPGIVKTFAYYFTPNILADCPNITARQALKISMKITKGYKGEVFIFALSWIGWMLLSALTLGILYIVYVGPYWYAADAGLYIELRDKALDDGRITREDLGWDSQSTFENQEVQY